MNNRRYFYNIRANAIHNSVVLKEPFAKFFSPVFRHDGSQPRVLWNRLDQPNNAFSKEIRVFDGIARDILTRGVQIGQSPWRPDQLSHFPSLRRASSCSTPSPASSCRRPSSTLWRKYSSAMMSSTEVSSGRRSIISMTVCLIVACIGRTHTQGPIMERPICSYSRRSQPEKEGRFEERNWCYTASRAFFRYLSSSAGTWSGVTSP